VESSSAAYVGIFAALFVAPLAWCDRRRYATNACWVFFIILGLSWCVAIPGFVQLLRLPVLNMMSHNRLVFLTSFAILALTAIGLENLLAGVVRRRWWFWLPAILLAGLCSWCFYRSLVLPEPVATKIERAILRGEIFGTIHDLKGVHEAQAWFIGHYTVTAVLCGLGVVGWLLLMFQKSARFRFFPLLAMLLLGDLLWFGYGRSAQCDPALYFPRIPVLDEIARSVPGRVIGINCLPPSLAIMAGLNDIRGYDAIDPARMVELLETTAEPGDKLPYAATQFLLPKAEIQPPGIIRLPPALDMLGLRYLIFRGAPPESFHPPFQGDDYWALVNSNALPRAFIPKSVETIPDSRDELKKISSPEFSPAEVAYVESAVGLPAACRGAVQITGEIPTRITMSVKMETAGLVVLADNWDNGWRAYYDGKPVPVLRANYAVRGVVVPAGTGTLEFIYQPASLILGLWLAGSVATALLCWLTVIGVRSRAVHDGGGGEGTQSVL
jgi:Bacterial membrane protein YfhO